MRIPCPWCGERPESEFHCGGTAHVVRPPIECSDQAWGDYLFTRENPIGPHAERWRHTYGCSQWFNLVRHTVTHEIAAVYRIGEAMPQAAR